MRKKEMAVFARQLLTDHKLDFLSSLTSLDRQIQYAFHSVVQESASFSSINLSPQAQDNELLTLYETTAQVKRNYRKFKSITSSYLSHINATDGFFDNHLCPLNHDFYGERTYDFRKARRVAAEFEAKVIKQLQAVARQRPLYSLHEFVAMKPEQLKPALAPTGYAMLENLRVNCNLSHGLVFGVPAWNNRSLVHALGPLYIVIGIQQRPTEIFVDYYALAARGATIISYSNESVPMCMPWGEGASRICLGDSREDMHTLIIQGQIQPAIDAFIRSLESDNPDRGYAGTRYFDNADNRLRTSTNYRRLHSFQSLAAPERFRWPGLVNPQCEVCKIRTVINSPRSRLSRLRLCRRHARQCIACLQWSRNDRPNEWSKCTRCDGWLCLAECGRSRTHRNRSIVICPACITLTARPDPVPSPNY